MAVVQISKIQMRRGRKNSGNGIPQLSSGEIAWAVDTQELFIGNGSIAEGAPFVGNTKVITEKDNILELAASYQFAQDDNSITFAVDRSLQNKLDEYVSVADFGAVNDGSTDCTEAFERAFTQLFRNANTDYRKILIVPNGEYLFTSNLSIPANAKIQGETAKGAILNLGANSILFINEAGEGVVDFDSGNRPRNINISNLTIDTTTGETVISGIADSEFNSVIFTSNYTLGNSVAAIATRTASVSWENTIVGTAVTDVKFEKCTFKDAGLAMRCTQTNIFETVIDIHECVFDNLNDGIYISGVSGQTNSWTISRSKFKEIYAQAFVSTAGENTKFIDCNFINCGNSGNTAASPASEIVSFANGLSNSVLNSKFNRLENAGLVTDNTATAIAEVTGSGLTTTVDIVQQEVFLSDSFSPFAVVSAENRFTHIDYTLNVGTANRRGRITIIVNEEQNDVTISDDYDYSVDSGSGGLIMTNFEFSAELKDNDADSGVETVVLSYKNPILTGSAGTIAFSVSYGV